MLLTNLSMGEQPRRDKGCYGAVLTVTVTTNLVAINRYAAYTHTSGEETVRDRLMKSCIFMSSVYFNNCSTQLHLAITRKCSTSVEWR